MLSGHHPTYDWLRKKLNKSLVKWGSPPSMAEIAVSKYRKILAATNSSDLAVKEAIRELYPDYGSEVLDSICLNNGFCLGRVWDHLVSVEVKDPDNRMQQLIDAAQRQIYPECECLSCRKTRTRSRRASDPVLYAISLYNFYVAQLESGATNKAALTQALRLVYWDRSEDDFSVLLEKWESQQQSECLAALQEFVVKTEREKDYSSWLRSDSHQKFYLGLVARCACSVCESKKPITGVVWDFESSRLDRGRGQSAKPSASDKPEL